MAKPLGLTLPLTLGSNGYFNTTTDPMEQVKTNLTNLLLTRKGERPFQPEFGCDVARSVFEPNTEDSLAEIHAEIQTAVSIWLPFIRIDDIKIKKNDIDSHEILVEVSYTVLTNNITDTIRLVF